MSLKESLVIFDHQKVVTEEDIDPLGHVGNLTYIRWMLNSATKHSEALGWGFDKFKELNASFVVRKHEFEYLRSAVLGDSLVIRTWVMDFRKISSRRGYEIWHKDSEKLMVRGITDWAFINLESGKPTRIPKDVLSAYPIVGETIEAWKNPHSEDAD